MDVGMSVRPHLVSSEPEEARAESGPTLVPESDSGLWEVADVCRYLKVSKSWVYQAAAGGELPSRKVRGLLRFVPRVVREWAEGK